MTPHHLLVLLLLTVAAGALRFAKLDRPPLLIDECFTFWRTCGSYTDLVNTLRDDGFVPLHYQLLWWIKEGFPIGGWRVVADGLFQTPLVMRFVPALCGTLMVPVVYFVARQLFSAGVALLAAGFAGCSAYAMFFSRDGKMYMPAWMLLTLAIGGLFWWLRTGRATAWLTWVAAGAAAAGTHVVTLLVLALAPLFLLSARRVHWRRGLYLLAGLALIAAGPAGYYLSFNRWTERSGGLVPGVTGEPAPDANWQASGLDWLGAPVDGPAEAFQSLSTYLTGYEWDGTSAAGDWMHHQSAVRIITAMCGLLALGALPWPARWRGDGARREGDSREPPWRASFWLACWVILPAYGFFYCRSHASPASPGDWLLSAAGWWGPHWRWLAVGTVVLAASTTFIPRVRVGLGAGAAAGSMILLIVCISFTPHVAMRFLGAYGGAVLATIVPAAIWVYCGNSTAERLAKCARFGLVVAALLLACAAANAGWASLRARSLALRPDLDWRSIWHTRYIGIVWPAIWIAAAALVMRLPTRTLRMAAICTIVVPNLVNGIARSAAQTQVPYDRVFADVWQSKPGARVRTYFDLNGKAFGSSGLPTSNYWKPIASYSLCLAGRLATSPVDFRTGRDWPFEYGPIVDRFQQSVAYRPFTNPAAIATDVSASPELERIIVWELDRMLATTPQEVLDRVGPAWQMTHDETIPVWWYWNWDRRMGFRRCEFIRRPEAAIK